MHEVTGRMGAVAAMLPVGTTKAAASKIPHAAVSPEPAANEAAPSMGDVSVVKTTVVLKVVMTRAGAEGVAEYANQRAMVGAESMLSMAQVGSAAMTGTTEANTALVTRSSE